MELTTSEELDCALNKLTMDEMESNREERV